MQRGQHVQSPVVGRTKRWLVWLDHREKEVWGGVQLERRAGVELQSSGGCT